MGAVPCLLPHSLCLRLFSVTSVASVVKSFLGCGYAAQPTGGLR